MERACDVPRDSGDPESRWSNPYRAPAVPLSPDHDPISSAASLAARSVRLAAVIIDYLCLLAAVTPPFGLFVYLVRTTGTNGLEPVLGAAILAAVAALSAVQIALLIRSGQTIGKKVMRIKIVDHAGRGRAPWIRAVGIRYLLNFALGQIPFYFLVDVAFIFGPQRRCLHDLMSRTSVVETNA